MAIEKMKFETSTGEKLEVPFFYDALSARQVRAIRKKHKDDAEELGNAFMETALPKEDYERVMDLSLRDFERFSNEWMENEDGSTGE